MDDPTHNLLRDLCSEARLDSHGEFQIDLVRAREKLEQHLGLNPTDYLAFLIQAAYALGGREIRLSGQWRSLSWEFDAPDLPPGGLARLGPGESGSLPIGLQRLQLALFLLSRNERYPSGWIQAGVQRLEWKEGLVKIRPAPPPGLPRLRLTLYLASFLDLHWLLSRTAMLASLSEYNLLKPRLHGSPMRLILPWKPEPALPRDPVPLALSLRGELPLPESPPWPALHTLRLDHAGPVSAWFLASSENGLLCFVHGLGYVQSGWELGSCWLYNDRLRTDLGQRQLVQGPPLREALQELADALAGALRHHLHDPPLARACRSWVLLALTRWVGNQLNNPIGPRFGEFLIDLPLFATVAHGEYSLRELDALYRQQGELLYYTQDPLGDSPPEAPPVVMMEVGTSTILTVRFPHLIQGRTLYAELAERARRQRTWSESPIRGLDIEGEDRRAPLSRFLDADWLGEAALRERPEPAEAQIFRGGRPLARVPLPASFPPGLLVHLEHPALVLNTAWSEPVGELWQTFLEKFWLGLPGWFAEIWPDFPAEAPDWLRARSAALALAHPHSQPLEELRFWDLRPGPESLADLRRSLDDGTVYDWILDGWSPDFLRWTWLDRLIPEEESRQRWRTRLQSYWSACVRWRALPPLNSDAGGSPADALARIELEGGGWLALRPLEIQGARWTAFRQGRYLLTQILPAGAYHLGYLPDGLVVEIEAAFRPNPSWNEILHQGEAWERALDRVRQAVPELLRAVLRSSTPQRSLAALRLLHWLPRPAWPEQADEPFLPRLDGTRVSLHDALQALQRGSPVRVLVESGDWGPMPGFEECWQLSREEADELASLFGPSHLEDAEADYLAARIRLEQESLGPSQEARLEDEPPWLLRQPLQLEGCTGEIGVRPRSGPANYWRLRLLRQGRPLLDYQGPLLPGPDLAGGHLLEVVADWPEAPSVIDYQELIQHESGERFLNRLRDRLRLFGFNGDPAAPELYEYLYERLAYEAGARESNNLGFRYDLDAVREALLQRPLFPLEGELWSLAQLLAYLREEGRLGYVLGDRIEVDEGPILWLNARELGWLRLLLGNSQLANLTHLRKTLHQKRRLREAPAEGSLRLPDLDYLARGQEADLIWGLQRDLNGTSRIAVLVDMRPLETLNFDWRYQIQASINLPAGQLNQDGSVRRDSEFQRRLEVLRNAVEAALGEQTPERYRLELGLWSWGLQEEWARRLQDQVLLADPRGPRYSLRQWLDSWQAEQSPPYLLEGELQDPELLALLPERPVALLDKDLALAARRCLTGLVDYRDGLRQAWRVVHEREQPDPAPASYTRTSGLIRIDAELDWTEQRLEILWRDRRLSLLRRPGWPGYHVRWDWSQGLLGQPLPGWSEVEVWLRDYYAYLEQLLRHPDLLEESRELWEGLPLAEETPGSEAGGLDQQSLHHRVAELKKGWRRREQERLGSIHRVCRAWLGDEVEVELEAGPGPARIAQQGEQIRLFLHLEHPWFRARSAEVVALRLSLWLQATRAGDWRSSVRLRLRLCEELGLLEPPKAKG